MPRRSKAAIDPASQVERIKDLLDKFSNNLLRDDLREQVRKLVPAFHALRDLGSGLVPAELAGSARDRILAYLRKYPKQLVDGDELLVVSGIGEWARRVRELRVEFGWWIYTGVTIREMVTDDPDQASAIRAELGIDPTKIRPDQYTLMKAEEDRDAAHRWNVLNTIRKKKAAVKTKIIEYLRANVGRSVTIEELRYLAGNKSEWARRVRELRTEDGWPVFTRMQGRSDLPVGTYVLDEDKQAEVHDRQIPDDVRVSVLTRDHFACTHCGWTREQLSRDDPRKFLELHHRVAHSEKGKNTVENLVTLCNVHHDQVHAKTLTLD
jgi:hypothetical protein